MNSTTIRGLQHISRFFDGRDTPSIQKALLKMAARLPDTTISNERHHMTTRKFEDKPGYGTAFWEPEEKRVKKDGSPNQYHPDYKGYVFLEMDYKAGDKLKIDIWEKQTRHGTTMLSLKEDNFTKKLRSGPQEDRSGYQKRSEHAYRRNDDDDNSVPF